MIAFYVTVKTYDTLARCTAGTAPSPRSATPSAATRHRRHGRRRTAGDARRDRRSTAPSPKPGTASPRANASRTCGSTRRRRSWCHHDACRAIRLRSSTCSEPTRHHLLHRPPNPKGYQRDRHQRSDIRRAHRRVVRALAAGASAFRNRFTHRRTTSRSPATACATSPTATATTTRCTATRPTRSAHAGAG